MCLPAASGSSILQVGARLWLGLTLALLLVICLVHIRLIYEPGGFLIGDCPYYAETAISLSVDHDLDLSNNLKGGLSAHVGQISMGSRGEWYPKHPVLLPILSLPLLPLFHMNSFLVVNVALMLALAWSMFQTCRLVACPAAASAATLGTMLGSFLILYDYNFSADLLSCFLVVAAVVSVARGGAAAAGLALGLSAFGSTSHVILLPPFAAFVLWRGRWRAASLFLAAALIPLSAQAALNWWMFGSPIVSPYMRIIDLQGDRVILHSQVADFTNPIWNGLRGQLLDPRKGLITTAPVLLVSALGAPLWFRRRQDLLLLCLGIGEFLFCFFASYRLWPTSQVGNRFLMPAVALSAPGLACLVDCALRQPRSPGAPGDGP
jgi:hypothetical protein